MHLGRGPTEAPDDGIAAFYDRLLACLKDPSYRDGQWQLLDARSAWPGNASNDAFIACSWTGPGDGASARRRQLRPATGSVLRVGAVGGPRGPDLALPRRAGDAVYDREGDGLAEQGLYLDLPAWGHHAFAVTPLPVAGAVTDSSVDGHDAAAEPVAVAMRRT